jgi:uncharacterized delta-60 repeat protein
MRTTSRNTQGCCRARARVQSTLLAALALAATSPATLALAPGQSGVLVTFPVSNTSDTAYAAALDSDGGVVMTGSANSGSSGALARVTASGAVDTAFGTTLNGIIKYDLSASTIDNERALVRTGDGHYAACGVFFSGPTTATDFLTVLFKSDGTLEGAFNGGYAVTAYLTSGTGAALYDQCNAVGVQSDGKIVSAGYTSEAGSNRVMVTRHTTAGALDGTFAGGGKIAIDASLNPAADSSVQAMIVLPNDKILLAGNAGGTFNNVEFLLMRLNADGTPDSMFGSNGIVRTPVGTSTDIANAIALQPDGSIVLAGSAVAADGRADFALARYDSSGILDTTFNSPHGFVMTPIGPGEDIAYAVNVMPWGRIVAAGSARISTSAAGTDIALAAYNSNGTLDKYFGNSGKVMTQATAAADEVIQALVTDVAHQHFWAVGAGVPFTNRDFLVLDFGLPDTIFRNGFEVPVP